MNLRQAVRTTRRRLLRWRNRGRTTEAVFRDVYGKRRWGGSPGEFYSGSGSRGLQSALYIDTVLKFIEDHEIRSVVDVGCGDFFIGSAIARACERYVGVDVVPELIARLQKEHGSDRIAFRCLDASRDALPPADLCLIRQVLQHLSNEAIQGVLRAAAIYPWVIVTEHYPPRHAFKAWNTDKVAGPDVRAADGSGVYLDKPPFNLRVKSLLKIPVGIRDIGEIAAAEESEFLETFLVAQQSQV